MLQVNVCAKTTRQAKLAWEKEGGPKKDLVDVDGDWERCLTAESVQSAALALQSVDDIHSSDSLPLGMLGVGDSITDDIFQENLEYTTGLLVDQAGDTLDTTTTCKTTDSRLGDTLDVITQNFAVTLGAPLSESLSSFAATRHDDAFSETE